MAMVLERDVKEEIEQLYKDMDSNYHSYIRIEQLYKYKDVVFSNDSVIDCQNLLNKILTSSVEKYSVVDNKYYEDERLINIQSELISLALDKGGKIDSIGYISFKNLEHHFDLFLNHPVNPISLEKLVERAVMTYRTEDEDGAYKVDTKYTKQKADLLEAAYKVAGASNLLDAIKATNNNVEAIVVMELFNGVVIDDQTLLKLTLKADGVTYNSDNNPVYDLESVMMQRQLLAELFDRGLNIESLSFTELNIEQNHVSVLKLLLEKGLDSRALALHRLYMEDALEVLNLALKDNVKITSLQFITTLFGEGISEEVFKTLISHMGCSIDDVLTPEAVRNDFITQGEKFKEYFDEFFKDVEFDGAVKPLFSEGGTLLHMIVKSDKKELVKYVLENYSYNINALNKLGQTPLFFAQSPEIAEALIEYQADLNIKDSKGDNWISNPSLDLIEYAVANNYLAGDYAERVALSHFSKGNYEHAAKLYKLGFELNVDPREQIVDSIMNGLSNSIEKNKYQVMLNLINKAGINIPNEFSDLLNSVRDDHKSEEFEFLNGLIHKLAQHYINLSKADLVKTLGESEALDAAFSSFDFSQLKLEHADNLELAKITDEFSAYYQIAGKALNILDNDFALEALTINGLRPDPIDRDITVYRGMKVNLSQDDIDSYFKFGHRGFSAGEYQKTLGFYVDQPWNELGGRWEYGGTYSSVEAVWAAHFADGITSSIEAESVLLEIKLPKGSAKICGSWKVEYEVVPSTIYGENIVAIYMLDIYSDKNGKHYQVNKVYQNPYIDSAITPHFKAYEMIKSDPLSIKSYEDLGCKDLPTLIINKSALYESYIDFIERYTSEDFVKDQAKLAEDYFSDREVYVEEFSYLLNDECDLRVECCA